MEDRTLTGWILVVGAALAVFLAAVAWSLGPVAPAAHGDPPEIREGAVLTVDPASIRGIDLRLVHEQLVPDWVRATSGMRTLHWERLRREVGQDPNLAALLDRMDELVADGPERHLDELAALVQTWNDVMASAAVAYRLSGSLGPGLHYQLKSYQIVLAGAEVDVGRASFGVTVHRRVDAAAPADAWLGQLHAHQDRVVVLLDRVISFTLDRIWPLLDPRLDGELDALSARFAPALRAEVARILPDDEMAALVETAEDRYWLLRATDAIHDRHACGSEYWVSGLAWDGLSPFDQAAMRDRAQRTAGSPCPDVTEREALVFAVRSMHVRRQTGVRDALERLVGHMATAVVAHEARHAADLATEERGPVCRGCPADLPALAIYEGSAYLTTFAQPAFATTALFQACDIPEAAQPARAAVVRFLAETLMDGGCNGAPPVDLAHRAQILEAQLFDRADVIEWRGLPERLSIAP